MKSKYGLKDGRHNLSIFPMSDLFWQSFVASVPSISRGRAATVVLFQLSCWILLPPFSIWWIRAQKCKIHLCRDVAARSLTCFSEYELLTGGGDTSVRLWNVITASSAQTLYYGSTVQPGRNRAGLIASSSREQPVQHVMFTPFGKVRAALRLVLKYYHSTQRGNVSGCACSNHLSPEP